MAEYPFWCECGSRVVVSASMSEYPKEGEVLCSACGNEMHRDFSGIEVDTFRPFTDPFVADRPIHFSSKFERDSYLKENNLTYDNTHWTRKPSYRPASQDITFDEVMEVMKTNGPARQELVNEDLGSIAANSASVDDSTS